MSSCSTIGRPEALRDPRTLSSTPRGNLRARRGSAARAEGRAPDIFRPAHRSTRHHRSERGTTDEASRGPWCRSAGARFETHETPSSRGGPFPRWVPGDIRTPSDMPRVILLANHRVRRGTPPREPAAAVLDRILPRSTMWHHRSEIYRSPPLERRRQVPNGEFGGRTPEVRVRRDVGKNRRSEPRDLPRSSTRTTGGVRTATYGR